MRPCPKCGTPVESDWRESDSKDHDSYRCRDVLAEQRATSIKSFNWIIQVADINVPHVWEIAEDALKVLHGEKKETPFE